ncbi:hypothetical protein IAU59_005645 [Kwoniella sp. CBS 9459]
MSPHPTRSEDEQHLFNGFRQLLDSKNDTIKALQDQIERIKAKNLSDLEVLQRQNAELVVKVRNQAQELKTKSQSGSQTWRRDPLLRDLERKLTSAKTALAQVEEQRDFYAWENQELKAICQDQEEEVAQSRMIINDGPFPEPLLYWEAPDSSEEMAKAAFECQDCQEAQERALIDMQCRQRSEREVDHLQKTLSDAWWNMKLIEKEFEAFRRANEGNLAKQNDLSRNIDAWLKEYDDRPEFWDYAMSPSQL